MKSVKLIATDMDGTLLDNEKKIPEENIEMIQRAQKAGIIVCAATGRDYSEAAAPIQAAGLVLPIIGTNGAEVYLSNGVLLNETTLEESLFHSVHEVLNTHGMYFELYTNLGAYTVDKEKGLSIVKEVLTSKEFNYTKDQAMHLAERRFKEGAVKVTDSYTSLIQQENVRILKLLGFSYAADIRDRVRRELADLPLDISASAVENLEITHEKATKGAALVKLADHFNIKMSDTLAIGDNENDLSMLKEAGFSAAMENASYIVKQAAGNITTSNLDAGVARMIQKVLSVEKKSL